MLVRPPPVALHPCRVHGACVLLPFGLAASTAVLWPSGATRPPASAVASSASPCALVGPLRASCGHFVSALLSFARLQARALATASAWPSGRCFLTASACGLWSLPLPRPWLAAVSLRPLSRPWAPVAPPGLSGLECAPPSPRLSALTRGAHAYSVGKYRSFLPCFFFRITKPFYDICIFFYNPLFFKPQKLHFSA